jgi:hypothetical protein
VESIDRWDGLVIQNALGGDVHHIIPLYLSAEYKRELEVAASLVIAAAENTRPGEASDECAVTSNRAGIPSFVNRSW